MNIEFACKLVGLIGDLGIDNFLILGGEPTLWPPLLELNKFCSDKGMKQTLVTNAFRFGEDQFWDDYSKHPNTLVGISVKAVNKEQLALVANVSNFNTLSRGLSRAISFFKCGVGVTYNTFYADTLTEIARFTVRQGATFFKLDFCSPAFIGDRSDDSFMVDPKSIVTNIIRDYPALVKITGGRIAFELNMPLCIWPPDFIQELLDTKRILNVCHLQKRRGVIFDIDGSVIMCNGLFDYPIGKYGVDYHDAETLLDFLNCSRVLALYDRINSFPSTKCASCSNYSICGGGCPLRWAVYDPDQMVIGTSVAWRT